MLVSIILPVFNAEKFIHRCVDSILQQTYRDIEMILIDDGSVDDSLTICNEYAVNDSRIRVFHEPNGGVSAARNIGIKHARGQYIQFVDADDYIDHTMTAELVQNIQKYDSEMVICGYNQVSSTGDTEVVNVCRQPTVCGKDGIIKKIYSGRIIGAIGNKLYKTQSIHLNSIAFDEAVTCGEDCIFNLDYIRISSRFSMIAEPLYYYVNDNDTSLTKKTYADLWEIKKNIFFATSDMLMKCNYFEQYQKDANRYVAIMIKEVFSGIFEVSGRYSLKMALNIFHRIIDDSLTKKALPEAGTNDTLTNIVVFCILHKVPWVLVPIFYIKSFIRKNCKRLFKIMKGLNYR